MPAMTVEDVQKQRAHIAQTQREVSQAEAEQQVRRERHGRLISELKDKFGLAPEGVPAWLEEQVRAAGAAMADSEAKRSAAETGLVLIKRAQAGEAVDLSRIAVEETVEEDLP